MRNDCIYAKVSVYWNVLKEFGKEDGKELSYLLALLFLYKESSEKIFSISHHKFRDLTHDTLTKKADRIKYLKMILEKMKDENVNAFFDFEIDEKKVTLTKNLDFKKYMFFDKTRKDMFIYDINLSDFTTFKQHRLKRLYLFLWGFKNDSGKKSWIKKSSKELKEILCVKEENNKYLTNFLKENFSKFDVYFDDIELKIEKKYTGAIYNISWTNR